MNPYEFLIVWGIQGLYRVALPNYCYRVLQFAFTMSCESSLLTIGAANAGEIGSAAAAAAKPSASRRVDTGGGSRSAARSPKGQVGE